MIANWLRKNAGAPKWLRRFANFYAPFMGAAIRIKSLSDDYRKMRVEMPLTWYNQNYVGTHFGGSMYAMTDPFYMMMLIQILGRDYVVWDKAAAIEFMNPGRRRLIVEFEWSEEEIESIRQKTAGGQKLFLDKHVEIHDDQGLLIAKVTKTLYVRKKDLASRHS